MDITWKHPQFQIRRNFPPEEEFEGITQVTSLEQSLYEGQNIQLSRVVRERSVLGSVLSKL